MPLQFARAGSVVHEPVFDSLGTLIGKVAAVVIVPSTGEVRYVIIAGKDYGAKRYIVVPAAEAKAGVGNVVVAGTADHWLQARRYHAQALALRLGVVGHLS